MFLLYLIGHMKMGASHCDRSTFRTPGLGDDRRSILIRLNLRSFSDMQEEESSWQMDGRPCNLLSQLKMNERIKHQILYTFKIVFKNTNCFY